jgi:hypothetical protein
MARVSVLACPAKVVAIPAAWPVMWHLGMTRRDACMFLSVLTQRPAASTFMAEMLPEHIREHKNESFVTPKRKTAMASS